MSFSVHIQDSPSVQGCLHGVKTTLGLLSLDPNLSYLSSKAGFRSFICNWNSVAGYTITRHIFEGKVGSQYFALFFFFFLLSNLFLQSHFFLCCFCVGWVLSPSSSACGLSLVLKSSSRPSLLQPSLSISVMTVYFIFWALSLPTCKANFEKL